MIYVGKAKNLRQRLNSYFGDLASLHFRTQTMVQTAAKVEWTVVQNDLEALQLEYTWIKQYDPQFNVKYRDDKSYPWLAITWQDEFPRVFVGRGTKTRGNRYFGPFGAAWAIRETVDLLLKVFPMRSCSAGTFRNAVAAGRPCLLGYIDKCSAPCVGRVSAEEHRRIVSDFSSFMSGNSAQFERRLMKQMNEAAQALDYERAAVLRDSLTALRQATERNAIVLPDGTDADVVALAEDPLEVAVHIFHVRSGRVRGERGWIADRANDAKTPELVESFLQQLYAEAEADAIPPEILVPVEPSSGESLSELLTGIRGARVKVKVPRRGAKVTLLDTVARNAAESLAQHKMKRASDLATRNRAMEELRDALELSNVPLRIECFDVSHTQGTEVVASMVVFEDALPRKSEYRRFLIKSFQGSNDVAAMREVISRRLKRLRDDRIDLTADRRRRFSYAPALIVVDGGAPQVAAAQAALEELGFAGEIALCGLAKRLEEVWIPNEEYPLILPRTSEGLYLLQRLRDESHRFAIGYHRSRRSAAMVESLLDDIPGLGEVRRKTLLKHFGSLRKLRAATPEQIQALPGFGERSAKVVYEVVKNLDAGEALNTATGEITDIIGQ